MVTAQQIADYILWSAHESGSFISNLKLQKLLYYVQAWHLAAFERPLIPETFEAWIHGPAIPAIYERYKNYGWRNIDEAVARPALDEHTVAFVDEVLEEYGPLDALRLESLSRREDPWIEARKEIEGDEPCFAPIDETVMRLYYRHRLTEAEIKAMQQEEVNREDRQRGEGQASRQVPA